MKSIYQGLILLIAIALMGCQSNYTAESAYQKGYEDVLTTEEAYEDQETSETSNNPINVERKLITEGRVSFETNDIAATRSNILKAIENNKGYISSDQGYTSDNSINATIVIRVPSENFDKLLSEATKGVKQFDNKSIDVKDVTEEFLDVQARLKTKKELEARYLELLKKANTVTEILEVESQVGQLRSEIESVEGRLKYLQNRVSFSTLTINFYKEEPHNNGFAKQFKNGFKNGWHNLILFFIGLINVWPFVLIIAGFLFGIRRWRVRKN